MKMPRWPRWLVFAAAISTVLAALPFAFIARARTSTTRSTRINIVPDMDHQPRFRGQQANPMFADTRAMRPPVTGTVARGELHLDDALHTGKDDAGDWITATPVKVDEAVLRRGRERYDIFCAPCHGLAGYGDGVVGKRAERLGEGTFTPPSSFHVELVRSRPDGQLFNTITNGIRTMPAYGPQIPPADRWAIVAYVRALQRSQDARLADVPAELRARLR